MANSRRKAIVVKNFFYDNEWTDAPNLASIAKVMLEVCQLNGCPGKNSETNEQLKDGWLVFKNWNIYHHALAYMIEKISSNKLETLGIKQFSLEQIVNLLKQGLKVIVSVENTMIDPHSFDSGKSRLSQGTHLVAIIDLSEDGKWLLLADPYVENHSNYLYFAKPEWTKPEEIEKYFKDKNERYGIAIAKKSDLDIRKIVGEIAYPLAKPFVEKV